MKHSKFLVSAIALLAVLSANAQVTELDTLVNQASKSKMKTISFKKVHSITVGLGLAGYLGDLTESSKPLNQPSFSFTVGHTYSFNSYLNIRTEFTSMRLKASDSKNSGAEFKARNLSFKTNVWELTTALEVNFISLDKHRFTPYLFAGVGAFYFNPFATDRNGIKRILQPLGTEGQGLGGYAGKYNRTQLAVPFGGGIKYVINRNVFIQLDVKYRVTGTDYLDDVSAARYPNKSDLDQRDLLTATLTYRGDEVGAGPYPSNTNNVPRGNPDKKDSYYTGQFKAVFNIGLNKKGRGIKLYQAKEKDSN